MIRGIRNILIGLTAVVLVLFAVYRFWLYPQYTVPILMYHFIDEGSGTLFVRPDIFEKQMKYLRDQKYDVISLDEFAAGSKSGQEFSRNTVVITFDDGRRDNYTYAFPVLKKYRVPATIFIITRWVGQSAYLTWDQIREMSGHGIDFGSHTQHHVYLPDADSTTIRDEVTGSREDIARRIGRPARHFCYPSGGFTDEAKTLVKEAGYLSASTTNRGYDRDNRDLYELMRIKVTNSDAVKPFHFWGKLSGYYNVFRGAKRGY